MTELRNNWNNIMLRMQKASRESTGVVLMRVSLVSKDGNPFFWLPPEVIPLEPRVAVGASDILNILTQPQLKRVLELILDNK